MYVNTVIIAGNLTRDPETKSFDNGSKVVNFTLAINRKFKTKDGEAKEDVAFIGCSAWNKTGDLVEQYLKKGSGALVIGRLTQDNWEDKDGTKKSKTKVVVENVQFLGGKKEDKSEDDDFLKEAE